MFTKNTLIVLAFLFVALNAQSLAFDLRSIKYTQANDFWTVDVPCIGGSGQYVFQYELPTGWKFENNKIKIPSSATRQANSKFTVRCRVKDTVKGDILERSLLFRPFSQGSSYSLEVTDHDYFYGNAGLNAFSSSQNLQGRSSIHGIDVLNRLGAMVKNTGSFGFDITGSSFSSAGARGGFGAGNGYLGQYSVGGGSANNAAGYSSSFRSQSYGSQSSSSSSSSSYSSSASLYSSLPSIGQLDKYIHGGAIVEIIQTIQLVVDSKIKCEAKVAYLSDFLGRIYAAIQVKKFTLNELKVIVTTALAQVQKLTVQITTIRSQQAALNVDELKNQLDLLINELRIAYNEYNNFNSNFSLYETEIVSLEREINEINIKFTDVQNNLQQWRRTSQSIAQEIAEYQARIRQLRERKSVVDNDITTGETFMREKDIRIREIKEKITVLKTKVSTASAQRQSLKQAYLQLEQRVNSAKSAFESASSKFSQFEQQIVSITVEIERYQRQTSELQGKQVAQCIENLESAITEIKESIDFVRYRCYNAGDVEIDNESKDRRPSYHFGQNQWFGYVNTFYSSLAEQIRNRIAQSFKKQVIEISTINVFSDLWKQNYGSCFEKDIASKAQTYKSEKSFAFSSDFSCSEGFSSAETNSGVIQNITSNMITVRGDDGKDYSLRLGSCSRFEGQGRDFVPRKGNSILWKGSRQSSSFNLHSCTCY